MNGLKKYRYNVASNVEAVEFDQDALIFNFKHWNYLNDKLAVVGYNQAHMIRKNGKLSLDSADLRLIRFDTADAY